MKMRRKTALCLVVCLLLSFAVVGCSNNKPSSTQKQSITVWSFPFISDLNAEDKMWSDFTSKFESENPNIKVDVQTLPWANRDQKMLTAYSAGKGPDVVYLIPDQLSQYAYMGTMEPLDNLIPKDDLNDYNQSAINADTVEGKLYGLPMLMSVMGWLYNTDLLTQAGWDINNLPKTWDDLLAMCKQVKTKTGKYGYALNGGGTVNMTFYPYLWQAGGDVLDKNGKTIINSDATKQALDFLKEIYTDGYTPPDSVTVVDHVNQFEQGQIACNYGDSAILQDTGKIKFKWALGPNLKNVQQVTYGTVGSWCISHMSTEKQAAAKWIEYITSKDQMQTFLKITKYFPPKNPFRICIRTIA
jgi:multiple sugar transport system substrate-binding protein